MATLNNPLPPLVECINNTEVRVTTRVDVVCSPADFERIAKGAKYYAKAALLEQDAPGEEWLFGYPRDQLFTMSGTYTFTETLPRSLLDTECDAEELFARYKIIVIEGGTKKIEAKLDSSVVSVNL